MIKIKILLIVFIFGILLELLLIKLRPSNIYYILQVILMICLIVSIILVYAIKPNEPFVHASTPNIPPLVVPAKGQLYSQFVIQEWNCNWCWDGIKWMTDQGHITQHILWLYQSVNALQENDTLLINGEYMFMLSQGNNPMDESYYKNGFIKALEDAMDRGAKVFILLERFYVGGRDKDGNCSFCTTNPGEPWGCDDESTGRNPVAIPPLYENYCWNANQIMKRLSVNKNFIYYDIGYETADNQSKPHNHFKTLSFYYKSTDRCSIYRGGWNVNSTVEGSKIEEAGFGFVSGLDEDWAQYHLYTDMQNMLLLENYYNKYTSKSTEVMSEYLKKNYYLGKVPSQPIKVSEFIVCGPHYCDPNFGCGAVGSGKQCSVNEQFVTAVDKDVSFTFGVDPAPQFDNPFIPDWKEKGWEKGMLYGGDLVKKLVSSSQKFLKTYLATQFLDATPCPTPSNISGCIWDLEPGIGDACQDLLKKDIPWFALQNDGWQSAADTSLIGIIFKDSKQSKNMYPKTMGFCGKLTISPSTGEPGYAMSHTKLWMNEKSVLISTAHPVITHYNADLTNADLLIENSPGMVSFMNNHFNYVYNKCGLFVDGKYAPVGKYKSGLPDNMSCANSDKCCTTDNYNIYIKESPFDTCQYPDSKKGWECTDKSTNKCELIANGRFKTSQECKADKSCNDAPPTPGLPGKNITVGTLASVILISMMLLYLFYMVMSSFKVFSKYKNNPSIYFGFILLLIMGVGLFVGLSHKGAPPPPPVCSDGCPPSFTCVKGKCILDSDKKTQLLKYMTSVYPSTTDYKNISDLELYNFFMYLGFYWVSYHNDVDDVLHIVDENFPSNVFCGGGFTNEPIAKLCGGAVNPQNTDDCYKGWCKIWPSYPDVCSEDNPEKCCCKIGSLYKPATVGSLYTIPFLWRDIEVMRNGYDYMSFFAKSVLYDPIYLIKNNKLNNVDPFKYLPLLKDGNDGSGKKLVYKCCDNSNTYDFTKIGCGYGSNDMVEISRDRGDGNGPDAFYYISSGTGNFLNLGTTIRSLNKIHAMMLIIRRAGELKFGSFTTYAFVPTNQYTTTKQVVNLSDGKIANSFLSTPQLLVLEFMVRSKYRYGMNNPGTVNGFGTSAAKKLLPNVDWPFDENGAGWEGHEGLPSSFYGIAFSYLLGWFFTLNKSKLPDINDFQNNWINWSKSDVDILGKFMDAITVPYFDSWELNFCFGRLADSAQPDSMIYQFVNPQASEIHNNGFTVNPLDVNDNPWSGLVNSDKKIIETITYSIQPNSSGQWGYEMADFRISPKSTKTCKTLPKCQTDYWTDYTTKFLKTGDPFASKYTSCVPYFCDDDNQWCMPGGTAPASWKILTCHPESKVPHMTVLP